MALSRGVVQERMSLVGEDEGGTALLFVKAGSLLLGPLGA